MNLMMIFSLLDVFRKGESLKDPKTWKNRAILSQVLAAVFLGLMQVAKAQGVELPFSEADATTVAAAFAIIVGIVSHYATSEKVGILPPKG